MNYYINNTGKIFTYQPTRGYNNGYYKDKFNGSCIHSYCNDIYIDILHFVVL